jgi:hypothetical protein
MCGTVKIRRAHTGGFAASLAYAVLAICLFGGDIHLTIAQPVSGPGSTANEPSVRTPAKRPVAPIKPGLRGTPVVAIAKPATVTSAPVTGPARVYLFRGALGPIFSRGMDSLTKEITDAGLSANVYEFTICELVYKEAIEEYKRAPFPIILIGHSMGGRCGLMFSEALQAEHIPVSLLVTIDPAHMSPSVPLNVERFINIFLSKNVLGGGDIKPMPGFQNHYASVDLEQRDEVSHITIDKLDTLHQQLLAKVLELASTPAKDQGEAVPIRYAVPPKAEIELWDSGKPVFAQPGDTLQTIAQSYNVPLWTLTQINHMQDNAPLAPGQRVVVPRHLVPLVEDASAPPPQQH